MLQLQSPADPQASATALVPYCGQDVLPASLQEQRLERLRRDRESHSHKQVWTKDPHGGRYRKVTTASSLVILVNHGITQLF